MPNRLRLVLLTAAFALVALPAAANAAPPSNDDFADAAPLTLGTDVSGTNLDATGEANEPQPGTINIHDQDCANYSAGPDCTASVWYTFQAPSDGDYTIETCDEGTDIDTVLGVWSGSAIDSLTPVASNDDGADECAGGGGTVGSRVTFTATSGVQYHVAVNGYSADQGSFYLRAYPASSPPAGGTPDTQIGHWDSFASARLVAGGETHSGPRHTASFDFAASATGASFQCSLDGASFSACSSPVSYDGLSGAHTFAVRAVVGSQVDPTPALQRFNVDNDPPDTTFTLAPTSPTSDTTLLWQASSDERNPIGFQCGLDSWTTTQCPNTLNAAALCNGEHEVRFAAIDPALNVDPTPAISDVTETGGGSCAAPTLGSINPTPEGGTQEELLLSANSGGYGGQLHVEYGTTTAYGASLDNPFTADETATSTNLTALQPSTLYHYRVTLTTPAGRVDSGDQTFTTDAASGAVPGVTIAAPVVVGNHAAAVPITVAATSSPLEYGLLIDDTGVANGSSPFIGGADDLLPSSSPRSLTIDVVDLDPGTYHARAIAFDPGSGDAGTSGDITFTVPAQPAPPSGSPAPQPPIQPKAPVSHFTLKRSAMRVGKITRHSRFVTLTLKGLPPHSLVSAQLNASVHASSLKRLASRRVHANSHGVAKIKIRLSKKARKLLRNRHTKSLSLRITVTPALQKPSHITLHPKLRR